jgi:ABC-type Na+ transport system ATPase subunit NatA
MSDHAEAVIRARGLTKTYGSVIALDGLDLEVAEGTVLGLLGPNGAGKTTAVSILTTLLAPDGGTATVAGHDVATDPDEVRRLIGLSGQYAAVDETLTGFENLDMIGRLYRLGRRRARERARSLLDTFGLAEAADRPVKTYSGGMRRRLDLAGALVAEPPVLFLDEPTTGLDPRSRTDLWAVIRDLVAGGAVGEIQVDGHRRALTVPITGGAPVLIGALRDLDAAGVVAQDVGLRRPTLDDVFLTLTGHAAEEDDPEEPDDPGTGNRPTDHEEATR